LTKEIVIALKKNGCFAVKIHGGPYQVAGLPDIVGCYQGRFFGLEVKLPGKEHKLTAKQNLTLRRIKEAGGISGMVIDPIQAVDTVIGHE